MAKKNLLENIDMTDEEKKMFAENVQGALGRTISYHERSIRRNNITTAIMYPLAIAFGFLIGTTPWIYIPIITVLGAFTHLSGWIGSAIIIKKLVKKYSNGKMNYKQYKQLVKSEELTKWLDLKVEKEKPAQVEGQANQQTTESKIDGVTLSPEEVAVLKKLMDKNIIGSVTVTPNVATENQNPTNPPKDPDTGRNS